MSRPPHSSGDTPQRPDTGYRRDFQRERPGSPLRHSRSDSGSGHSLRSETAGFPR